MGRRRSLTGRRFRETWERSSLNGRRSRRDAEVSSRKGRRSPGEGEGRGKRGRGYPWLVQAPDLFLDRKGGHSSPANPSRVAASSKSRCSRIGSAEPCTKNSTVCNSAIYATGGGHLEKRQIHFRCFWRWPVVTDTEAAETGVPGSEYWQEDCSLAGS